ncbi:hypothetical protein D9615_009012 [Tricholomella constricta]|uniref:Uncharacterized protein n=1 Tax=Tricholomella constricta TaxID=117010 RepID=A0A8H5LZ30_9AGAR|nr:hypothetical protein D9615_009012 [Tricholomella constricta]
MLIDPNQTTGWVNGNLYQPTTEVAGVLPIPADVRLALGMGTFASSIHSKQRHHFLASMQGTRKPVLPVHNAQERDLFCNFMMSDSGFNDPVHGPSWEVAVRLWNNTADTTDGVFYKLTEQLKVYYNGDWKRNTNTKQTKAMTAIVRVPLKRSLCDPRRSSTAPKALERPQNLHTVPKGLLPDDMLPVPHLPVFTPPPARSVPIPSGSRLPPLMTIPSTSADHHSGHEDRPEFHVARKRALASLPELPAKKRKGRTCRKCGVDACPGKKSVDLCRTPCRDCSKQICRGRNPNRPTRPCNVGWDD